MIKAVINFLFFYDYLCEYLRIWYDFSPQQKAATAEWKIEKKREKNEQKAEKMKKKVKK